MVEQGTCAGSKGHHGGRNITDYQFGGYLFTFTHHPMLWFTKANIHFRSAISNVTGPLLPLGKETKVYPPFRSSVLFPDLLMNIANWFTEERQSPWHSLQPAVSKDDASAQIKSGLLQAFLSRSVPPYLPCNRKWDVLLILYLSVNLREPKKNVNNVNKEIPFIQDTIVHMFNSKHSMISILKSYCKPQKAFLCH